MATDRYVTLPDECLAAKDRPPTARSAADAGSKFTDPPSDSAGVPGSRPGDYLGGWGPTCRGEAVSPSLAADCWDPTARSKVIHGHAQDRSTMGVSESRGICYPQLQAPGPDQDITRAGQYA